MSQFKFYFPLEGAKKTQRRLRRRKRKNSGPLGFFFAAKCVLGRNVNSMSNGVQFADPALEYFRQIAEQTDNSLVRAVACGR